MKLLNKLGERNLVCEFQFVHTSFKAILFGWRSRDWPACWSGVFVVSCDLWHSKPCLPVLVLARLILCSPSVSKGEGADESRLA